MAVRLGIDLYAPSHEVADAVTDRDRYSFGSYPAVLPVYDVEVKSWCTGAACLP